MGERTPERLPPSADTADPNAGSATAARNSHGAGIPAPFAVTETQSFHLPVNDPEQPPTSPDSVAEHLDLVNLGRYRIGAKLGSGGFGSVYQGYDEELHRDVAIKVPHPHRVASAEDADAYLAEARFLARLDHPGIVPIFDFGRTEDGLCYLVSKFIEGCDLSRRIKQGGLSDEDSARLIAEVAEALHHAHQRGIVHRDIKPGNILIDASGKPIVVDFGLALREEEYGMGPTRPGTPAYMSPEQARDEGHLVDARTDIYSLGVILYELLAGRRPFRANDLEALREEIKNREPRPPRQLNDAVPRELDRICLKALSKRVSDRYSTALDMADDLRQWLAERPPKSTAAKPIAVASAEPPPSSGQTSATVSASETTPVSVLPKGLRSFDAADADFFLSLLPGPRGRDGLPDSIRFWKARLEEMDPDKTFRVGLIYGPSGCGKSSLVRAGLLPRLAEHVGAVYVEATPGETVARLRRALRKLCPELSEELSLGEVLIKLRRGRGLADGRKIVLFLDQFEQWLHVTRGQPNRELVQALRQCDGQRIQCVILVRDDYWMTTTRFMHELEVPLAEGENSLAVDLFDPRHARKVLAGFGRSYGTFPEGALTPEQERFLDRAIAQLCQEGKVVPVRLSLFAEMVKGKPWTPATLRESGGAEGLGVTFLEETFCASTAPPEHRLHQGAARAVLKEMLPEQGTHIKGRMQPYDRLLAASGYARSPHDFDDLLHILDTELRLVTPADRDEAAGASADERYYQLTHDYLVHALRQWLTAKQRESRRGRAELRLTEQAALWSGKHEKRYLPTAWEWAEFVLLTRRVPWTEPQSHMMAAATRQLLRHGLAILACFLLLILAGVYIVAQFDERHQAAHADALRARLLVADIGQVPGIIESLDGYRDRTDPELARIANDTHHPAHERLRASLALVGVDEGQVPYLFSRLLASGPDELLVIRELLRPRSGSLVEPLWKIVQDAAAEPGTRLRAACALADFDPEDERWQSVERAVSGHLVKADPLLLRQWLTALRPVRRYLLGSVAEVYRLSPEATERSLATSILSDYAADNPALLIDLLKDADVHQYVPLFGKLVDYPDLAVAGMAEELTHALPANDPESKKQRLARRKRNAAVTLFRMGKPAWLWPLLRHSADPRTRSYLIHALAPLGAKPDALVERFEVETDVSARRALLLCLGEFGKDGRLAGGSRDRVLGEARRAFGDDPDAGIHSAAEWLLRAWGAEKELCRIEEQLKRDRKDPKRGWYVNREGHTMVTIEGRDQPVVVSPGKKVERRFAIASKEVTIEQFLRFRRNHRPAKDPAYGAAFPVNGVTWYDAACYCRWLSEQEQIPEEQMCYPPIPDIKEGMRPFADYLSRTGYRLPTEAEWELACRAGATTPWFIGGCEEMLTHYAWFDKNSGIHLHPVAGKKPNDFGLFDMHGNAMEWCQGTDSSFKRAGPDREDTEPLRNDVFRATRGGSHHQQGKNIAATHRDALAPTMPWYSISFRVVRTCR